MNHPAVSCDQIPAKKFPRVSRVLALAAILAGASLAGCVMVTDNHTTTTGHKISDTTFAQIDAGKSKDFVASLLGDPSEKSPQSDGSEIWRWRYTEDRRSSGGFIVLFASNSDTKTEQTRFVEFNKDGSVTRAWTE